MESFLEKRWFPLAACLAIAVLTVLAYSNTFYAPFQFDDRAQIVNNRLIKDLGNIPAIFRAARPVTQITFALNFAADGLNVLGYHLVNLSIHVLNSVLAFFLVSKTMRLAGFERARANLMAAFSALIFALHPVQTQAVTYIVQRSESLSGLFYLASLLLFIKGAETRRPAKRLVLYILIGATFALGFYSKEIAFTLPLAVLLYDFYFIGSGGLREVSRRWPLYLILGALFAFFTVNNVIPLGGFNDLSPESSEVEIKKEAVEPEKTGRGLKPQEGYAEDTGLFNVLSGGLVRAAHAGSTGTVKKSAAAPAEKTLEKASTERVRPIPRPPSAGLGMKRIISPKEYLLTEMNVLVYYVALLVVPVNQNIDYDFPVSESLFKTPPLNEGTVLNIPIPPPFVSLMILLIIALAAVFLTVKSFRTGLREGRVIGFFVLLFFILLSPTSSFIPILDVIFEHRLYLSTLAFSVVLATSLDLFIRKAFYRKAGGQNNC